MSSPPYMTFGPATGRQVQLGKKSSIGLIIGVVMVLLLLIVGAALLILRPWETKTVTTGTGGTNTTCQTGFVKDPTTGACVPQSTSTTCQTGYVKDPTTGACVPLSTGSTCQTGYVKDPTTGACVPQNTSTTCPTGYARDYATGACVPLITTCPTGYVKDPITGSCLPQSTTATNPVVEVAVDGGFTVPTEADATSGEILFNCKCVSDKCVNGGYLRGDVLKVPLSEVKMYDDCSSTAEWFCCTTEACSHYCKLGL